MPIMLAPLYQEVRVVKILANEKIKKHDWHNSNSFRLVMTNYGPKYIAISTRVRHD